MNCLIMRCSSLLSLIILYNNFLRFYKGVYISHDKQKWNLRKTNFFSISIDCKKTLLFKKVLCLNVSARTCNSLQNNGRIHQSEGLEGDDFYTMFKVTPCHCFNFLLLFLRTQKTHLRIWFLFIQKKWRPNNRLCKFLWIIKLK